jgi:hypothetical protein
VSTKTHAAGERSRAENAVVAWRLEQLRGCGFDESLAEALAGDCRFDLHRLIGLVERGCPPPLAARILAPIDDDKRAAC